MATEVIVQPSNCSKCQEGFDNSVREARFLKCGCVVCAPCSTSKKLRTLITCPTCAFQYNLQYGDMVGYYHASLEATDIDAQKRRCHVYRDYLRTLEDQLQEMDEEDPLSSDLLHPPHISNPVLLSDDSLEISSSASDIEDEYKNTQYCIIANRLAKLIAKRAQLTTKLNVKQDEAAQPKAKSDEKDQATQLSIQTEKQRRRTERRKLVADRRLRLLAQHDAQLDEEKEVKKVKRSNPDDEDEPEPEEEDEEGANKIDPNDIDQILLQLQGPKGHFVKLTYKQRWRLKINGWKTWKDLIAERSELAETRIVAAIEAEAEQAGKAGAAKAQRRVAVLRRRAAELKQRDAKVTAYVDGRLAKLENRGKHTPGRTVLTKKLEATNEQRIYILSLFYPERLPKVEEKKEEDDDDY